MKETKRSLICGMLFTIILLLIAGCNSTTSPVDEKAEEVTKSDATLSGGEIRVALTSQPPTLDQHLSTTTATRDTARLMFETLLTTNSNYQATPMLASSVDISDDNKTYTFHLRKGVTFHNGKEMTAEDVVASMERWVEHSSVASPIFDNAIFEVEDDHTVVLTVENPSMFVLDTMASAKQAAAIMPKEVIETASTDGVTEYIGTGPFKFVEWKQDQFIHFTKYEEYQPVEEEADGLAGKKEALVDDVYFYIVSDASTRLTGLQTDQYDIAYSIPVDNYDQVKSDPNLYPVLDNYGEILLLYNEHKGLASNAKIRQAVNIALDIDEVMGAAFPHEDLYWLSPGYMTKVVSNWASDAGLEYYNQGDKEKAKELLKEGGYNNEEFRILTTRDYPEFYTSTVVIQEQLSALGMNVKLEVYDWPTLLEKQNKPGEWDAMIAGSSTVTTPSQLIYISSSFAGGITDEKIPNLLEEIGTSNDQQEAKKLWDELQGYAWEQHLPLTILGGYNNLFGANNKIKGLETLSGPIYWNTRIGE